MQPAHEDGGGGSLSKAAYLSVLPGSVDVGRLD